MKQPKRKLKEQIYKNIPKAEPDCNAHGQQNQTSVYIKQKTARVTQKEALPC